MRVGNTAVRFAVSTLLAILLYLLFWPVPFDPVAYTLPANAGLIDPYAPNDRLRPLRFVDLEQNQGPEDLAMTADGRIVAGTSAGHIIRFNPDGTNIELFADVGGRPLGLEFDATGNLLVANAFTGLQNVSPDGQVTVLANEFAGQPFQYLNDVAVAADGAIYFTESTTRYGASYPGDTYHAAVLDLWEHGNTGRVLRYDPLTHATSLILDGLTFANGIAISADQRYLVIAETASYRIIRHWLSGPRTNQTEIIVDNLPGAPDNINSGMSGKFWVALISPRSQLFDDISDKPWLRKVVWRLPERFKPSIAAASHVLAISGEGDVLMNLQDTTHQLPALTGVLETRDSLWLSTLFGNRIGHLMKIDLAN